MYFKKYDSLPLPTTGHLHILKTGYVYWEKTSSWDNKNKRPKYGRISIGKLDPEDSTRFYPNDKYFEIFSGQKKKIEDKKEVDQPLPQPSNKSFTQNFGGYIALIRSLERSGALASLKQQWPDQWENICALAAHAVLSQDSTAQSFPFWSFSNYCGKGGSLNDSQISTVFQEIGFDQEEIYDFLYSFQQNYMKSSFSKGDTLSVVGDSTNINTSCQNNELAQFGEAKVDEDLPIVNTFVLADLDTGIPLYFEEYFGSLIDKSQIAATLEQTVDLGYKKLYAVLDRGHTSRENLKKLQEGDYEFAMMMPGSLKKVKELIPQNQDIKDNMDYYIPEEKIFGKSLGKIEILERDFYGYIYYDSFRADEEKISILNTVQMYKEKVEQRKRYTDKMKEQFSKWLIIEPADNAKGFTVEINRQSVQKALNETGWFVVIDNTDKGSSETIIRLRKRDKAEKEFCRLKTHLGMDQGRVHSTEEFRGKMLTAFVGLIMVESFRALTRYSMEKRISDTVETDLALLNKYQIQQNKNQDGWLPSYAMTKKQKALFASLGLKEKDVKDMIYGL
ncbi:MAG: hypothetical protein Q4A59_04895 [Erysipelotrichaceae bacterium]|nr:hypothetical protein [Erysipelotrichaceae bacterium]